MWVDAWAFERASGRLLDGLAASQPPADLDRLAERALRLYQGHFLERDPDAPWLMPARARLASRFRRLVAALGGALEQAARWADAVALYQRALELNNLAEDLYRRLMFCHREQGRPAEALAGTLGSACPSSAGSRPTPSGQLPFLG